MACMIVLATFFFERFFHKALEGHEPRSTEINGSFSIDISRCFIKFLLPQCSGVGVIKYLSKEIIMGKIVTPLK